MKILIINGPNLNILGNREPEIYGKTSMEDFLNTLEEEFPNDEISFYQSNIEGEIILRLILITHTLLPIALKIFKNLK